MCDGYSGRDSNELYEHLFGVIIGILLTTTFVMIPVWTHWNDGFIQILVTFCSALHSEWMACIQTMLGGGGLIYTIVCCLEIHQGFRDADW